MGSRETSPGRVCNVGRPLATVKATIKQEIYKAWANEWSEMGIANHSRSFYSGPNPGKAKFVYKLARLELGRFIRIITGHNNLNFFQTKTGLFQNAGCRFCDQGNETLTHLLNACPMWTSTVMDFFLDKLPTDDMLSLIHI